MLNLSSSHRSHKSVQPLSPIKEISPYKRTEFTIETHNQPKCRVVEPCPLKGQIYNTITLNLKRCIQPTLQKKLATLLKQANSEEIYLQLWSTIFLFEIVQYSESLIPSSFSSAS